MRRGWIVLLNDGKEIYEGEMPWKEIPKRKIKKLSLIFDGRRWDLTGKEAYFVKYRASMVPGVKESFRIEKRTIGYYEGANKICYTVNEGTGEFKLEVINGR
jgi:hypothetical protein